MATKPAQKRATVYKGAHEIDLLELQAHPDRFQGTKVILSGTVLGIEATSQGKDYILLDIPVAGDVKGSVDVAVDWGGPFNDIERGVSLTLWGTLAGTHVSGGRACGFTVSPLVVASRLECEGGPR